MKQADAEQNWRDEFVKMSVSAVTKKPGSCWGKEGKGVAQEKHRWFPQNQRPSLLACLLALLA